MYIVRYFELNSTFHNLTSQIFNILCNQDSIQWLTQFVVYLHWPRTEAINSEYPWKLFSSPTEIRTRNSRMKIWRHNPLTIGPFIWWIQREVSHYPTLLQLERVIGIEPTSRPWKGHILTVVLYSQNLCGIGRIRTYSVINTTFTVWPASPTAAQSLKYLPNTYKFEILVHSYLVQYVK